MQEYVVNRPEPVAMERILQKNPDNAAGTILRLAWQAGLLRDEIHRLTWGQIGAVDKVPDHLLRAEKSNKKDAHRRHPIHLIILFKFKEVAERRQWSSAASKPRRKTRVKLCPHFWAAKVPSHQICRLRSASR